MKTRKKDRDSLRVTIERSNKEGYREWGDGSILNLMDDIDTLKAALEQVEWDDAGWCPWCGGYEDSEQGHYPDCPRQLALYGESNKV